jgi:hypothetical protein
MPEEIKVKPRHESAPSTTQTESAPAAAQQENPSTGHDLSPYIMLCAGGLFASFFMPWVNILFGRPSGFDLQKLGDLHRLYWAIPAFSAVAILAALTKKSQRQAAQIAGAAPYVILIYWLAKFESHYADLLNSLNYGAYLALGCGLSLEILARRMK